jgi:uncharacterized repeat protein (TIGR03803 family)
MLSAVAVDGSFVPAPDGLSPQSNLVMDGHGNLFGTTSDGGQYGHGTIFEIAHGSGALTTLASFQFGGASPGFRYSGLTLDSSGNLYGTSQVGGAYDNGTLFELGKGSHSVTILHSFTGGSDGSQPRDGVILDASGDLFGSTSNSVFELSKGSTDLTILGTNGWTGPLVLDKSGNLFGTSPLGFYGSIIEIAKQGSSYGPETAIASFNSVTGAATIGGVVADGGGNLYGISDNGIYELPKGSSTIALIASQDLNPEDGGAFYVTLAMDPAGNMFGTTTNGGSLAGTTPGNGTIFELAKNSGAITTLYTFPGGDNSQPRAGVILDSAGNLFGTTYRGGNSGYGSVFELRRSGKGYSSSVTTIASLGTPNGAAPLGGVVRDAAGNLYGTTYTGGAFGYGTVYTIRNGSSTITTLASFNNTDGANPAYGSLAIDSQGNLFGTTQQGGNGTGTVFEIVHGTTSITTLADFANDGSNGAEPYAGVVLDKNGNLWGTTYLGGANDDGTVFEIAKGSRAITTIGSFDGTDGENPYDNVTVDAAGNLYGTTSSGGSNEQGAVFEIASGSKTITDLYNFTGGADVGTPVGGITVDAKGNLFGTTNQIFGGTGTIFEIAHGTGAFTTLYSFAGGPDGADPVGNLVFDAAGNLYGMTYAGGAQNLGTVFELAKAGTGFSASDNILASFDATTGQFPTGSLLLSGGILYGTTSFGGIGTASFGGPAGAGVVFQLLLAPAATAQIIPSQPANHPPTGPAASPNAGSAAALNTPLTAPSSPTGRTSSAAIGPSSAPVAAKPVASSAPQVHYVQDLEISSAFQIFFAGFGPGPNGDQIGIPAPDGQIFCYLVVNTFQHIERQTGVPSADYSFPSATFELDDLGLGLVLFNSLGQSGDLTASISDDLHTAQADANVPLYDTETQEGLFSTAQVTVDAPKTTGVSALNDIQLQGNGQSDSLNIVASEYLNSTTELNFSVDPGSFSTRPFFSFAGVSDYMEQVSDQSSLGVTGLPPTPTKTLAAISALQAQNNLAGSILGTVAFEGVLAQDVHAALPALKGLPTDAASLLQSALGLPSVAVNSGTQASASITQSADANFDNGSPTQDIDASADISSQTTLLPLPVTTANSGNVFFSAQDPATGTALATGPLSGGIVIAPDATSASLNATVSLPETDAFGDPLGDVNASANLKWQRASGPASFNFEITNSTSPTSDSLEYSNRIAFPAAVSGILSADVPGYVQPPLVSGDLAEAVDLVIGAALPAPREN